MTSAKGNSGQPLGRPRSFSDTAAFIATADAIKQHGYAHLTMGDIAAELSCSAPALLSRFGSRKGLLRAFLEWGNRASAEGFRSAKENSSSPLDALRSRFRISNGQNAHEFGDPLTHINIVAFHAAAWTDERLHDLEADRRVLYLNEVTAMLEAAVRTGEIEGCDPTSLGRTMVAAIAGSALQWVVDPDPEDVGGQIVGVIDELLRPYLVDGVGRE